MEHLLHTKAVVFHLVEHLKEHRCLGSNSLKPMGCILAEAKAHCSDDDDDDGDDDKNSNSSRNSSYSKQL